MRIHNFSIGARLGAGFAAVLCLLAAMMAVGEWRLGLAQAANEALDVPLAKERLVSAWYANVLAGTQRTKALVKAGDSELETMFAEDAKVSKISSDRIAAQLDKLPMSADERRMLDGITQARKAYVGARDKAYQLRRDGQVDAAGQVFEKEFVPNSATYVGQMQSFMQFQRDQIDTRRQDIATIDSQGEWALLMLGAMALGAGALCSVLLTRSITRPLRGAMTLAQAVAKGDLSYPVHDTGGRDEIAQLQRSLLAMTQNLGCIVRDIRESAQSIKTASHEVAGGNADLSSRTEQSASNLQQTAASMEQLTSTVNSSTEAARQAEHLAQAATAVARQGSEAVAQVVSTMQEIDRSSQRIGDIIGTIDAIAFQTNILALNAAVEAARAGEQGRGFAVVAGEVRGLAQRCAAAAREVKALISQSTDRVAAGSRIVVEAGGRMDEIMCSVQRVTDIVGAISMAAGEQKQGIGQVNEAVAYLERITQQNAALVEESAAAAQSLSAQAQRLSQSVMQFRLQASTH